MPYVSGMSSAAARLSPLQELIARGEDARLELIDGVLSTIEATGEHSDAQSGLLSSVRPPYHRRTNDPGGPGGWWIYVEPSIQFTLRNLFRPDLAGWRRERVPERPVGFPIPHVPDWVCEVLSPSNQHHDLTTKRRVYHAAKVGHYCIVDPIREEFTVLRWSLDGYVILDLEPVEGVLRAPPFPEAPILLASLFGKD
jgi:Uma2 family endonuclease